MICLEVCPSIDDPSDDVTDQCRDIIKRLQNVNPEVSSVTVTTVMLVPLSYNNVSQWYCILIIITILTSCKTKIIYTTYNKDQMTHMFLIINFI